MKTKVTVRLVAECEVEIEVDYEEDQDPTDLTREEERKALGLADRHPSWRVEKVWETE